MTDAGRRDYWLSLGYLDEALSFIASERAWYAVQMDRDVGQGWGRTWCRSRWRHGSGKSGQRLCLRRLPWKMARRTLWPPRPMSDRSAHTHATITSLTSPPRGPRGTASPPPPSLLNLRYTKATPPCAQ